jgi:glycosyltransferase involved in cell wall biosynthesis
MTSEDGSLVRGLRVLAISAEVPSPVGSGGSVRAWHCLRALAQDHRVHLCLLAAAEPEKLVQDLGLEKCSVCPPSSGKRDTSIRRLCGSLFLPTGKHGRALLLAGNNICVERGDSDSLSLLHRIYGWWLVVLLWILRRFVLLDPLDLHLRPQADRLSSDVIEGLSGRIDAIWIEHSYLYPLAERCRDRFVARRILVNAHNVEHHLKRLSAEACGSALARSWQRQVSELCRQIETRMLRDATLVICCSDEDRLRFGVLAPKRGPHATVAVVANGVDTGHFCGPYSSPKAPCLIFTGTGGYGPNDDAVKWLLIELLPQMRKRLPELRLIVAGRHAEKNWGTWVGSDAGTEVHSDVPDIRPLMQRATAAIVPLRQGSGTRFKILEAMSMELPVISTSLGAEGLNVQHRQELLLADSVDDISDAVVAVFANAELRQGLATAGRRLVCEKYDWAAIEAQLRSHLRQSVSL